jgi:eukaryotic-like serine/threonine-protein kinase
MTTFTYDTAPYEQMLGATLGSYRLERVLDLNELGPTYLARGGASNATYRLRLLTAGTNLDSRERAAYLEHAGELAAQLATLQHPNILSLVDSGVYRGLPYLIYPNLAMRSLSTLVTEDGPMDSTTAGRYVGQAARALDYAHGRGILHGDLSTDCIYLQADGQIVVADFSVRRMIELAQRQGGDNPAAYSAEACAPEQLLGEAVGPATDVYALGAALFRLLSGEPVYRGATHEQIAEQHLRAPIPTLSARRPDLPRQLDTVLAHAMAKEPAERFPQATLLADALDQAAALGAQAPNSRPMGKSAPSSRPMGKSAPSSRPMGKSAPSSRPADMRASDMRASDMRASNSSPLSGQGAAHANGSVGVAYVEAAVAPGAPIGGPGVAATQRPPSAVRWWTAALIITLIVVIAGSIFALRGAYSPPASVAGTGQAFFQDAATGALGHSDAIRITSTGLSKPPSGSEYDAWLIDTQSERVIALGTLASSDGGKTYNVSYARAAAETGGVNLLAVAD